MGTKTVGGPGQAAGPSLLFLSSLSPSFPFSDGPPPLPSPTPPGPPQLSAEETQPQTEGGWREGEEVRLVCSARGYPEPKLSWSQLGGSVRDCPLHPEPRGTQAPSPSPLGVPAPLTGPSIAPLHFLGDWTASPLPSPPPLRPGAGANPSPHSQQSQPSEGRAG